MKECSNISYSLGFIVLRSITKIKKSITSCYKDLIIFYIFLCALYKKCGVEELPGSKIAPDPLK